MARNFRQAGHLPNRREGAPADPGELPRQRAGATPQLHGRYPDHDVMSEAGHWDEQTRKVVFARLAGASAPRFFTPAEQSTLTAFCDTVLAQDSEPRIPVLGYIDERLAEGRFDGFQYFDMPSDDEAWRLAARGLDEAAGAHGHERFADCDQDQRLEICGALAGGELEGGVWSSMPPERTWKVLMRYALSAFYAHPWAWNEIGFAGPAYPRGFSRFGPDQREDWEGAEAFELDPVEEPPGRA